MVRRAALGDAERGAGRPGADQCLSARSRRDALVGMGRGGTARRCLAARARVPARARSARRAPRARRSRSSGCELPAGSAARGAAEALREIVGRDGVATTTARGCCTRRARATPTSCACARARPTGRRTRCCSRATTSSCARCSSCARAHRSRVVPVRRRHERGRRRRAAGGGRMRPVIALDMGRMAAILGLDAESSTVARPGGHARAGARALPRLARVHARPFPAVLRVRVARGLRGDALGGAGVDAATARSRRWCSGCASRRRRRASTLRACRRAPRGRSCASCWSARRARSGVISELDAARAPARAERRLRGRFLRELRGGRARRCASSRASTRCRTSCASPTSSETRISLRSRAAADAQGSARARLPRRCAAIADGCLAILGFEGSREEVAVPARACAGAALAPRRARRRDAHRDARG